MIYSEEKIILLVDDDEDDRVIFCDCLAKLDPEIQCITAVNGKEALEKLHTLKTMPVFIFLDINMPIMNGFECLTKLKENEMYADISVVMYSTSDDIRAIETAKILGAEWFLTKPASHKELESKLKKIIVSINA